MLALKRTSESLKLALGQIERLGVPHITQRSAYARMCGLGQMTEDVSLLVSLAALHHRELAVDVSDRAPQRLRSVDDKQYRALGGQPSLDEVGEQRGGDPGVLGAALAKS